MDAINKPNRRVTRIKMIKLELCWEQKVQKLSIQTNMSIKQNHEDILRNYKSYLEETDS